MNDQVGNDNGGVVVLDDDFTAILTPMDKVVRTEVILRNIFRVLGTSSLASCRLVCKLWRSESDHLWQRSVYYKLHRPFIVTDAIASSHRNIKTEDVTFVDDEVRMFKVSVGSTLRSLYLFRHTFNTVNEFRKIIFKSLPQLEELKLSYCNLLSRVDKSQPTNVATATATEEKRALVAFKWGYGDERLPVSWYELFGNFPMLTNFENNMGMMPAEINELFNAIRVVRKANSKNLPFKRFRLASGLIVSGYPTGSRPICAIVKELMLPVPNMSIMVTPELSQELIIEMLNVSSSTLTLLSLSTVALTNPPPSDLLANVPYGVKMDALKYFVVHGNDLKSLSFLTYMPNLACLEIYEPPSKHTLLRYATPTLLMTNSTENDLTKLSSLKRLRLEYIVNGKQSLAMISAMINLQDVSMVFDFREFLMVCDSCPRLRNLTVLGDRLDLTQLADIDRAVAVKRFGEYGSRIHIENLTLLETLTIADVSPARHAYWSDGSPILWPNLQSRVGVVNMYDY